MYRPGHRSGFTSGPPPQPRWATGPGKVYIVCPECKDEHAAIANLGDGAAIMMELTAWYLSHWIQRHWGLLLELRQQLERQ